MSGVSVNLRLGIIANKIPGATAAALRQGLAAADEYLAVNMPFLTGYMIGEHYGRVVNQYRAEIVSPAYYTVYQEEGFFNVWAGRWLAGRFFMRGALEVMTEVTVGALEGFINAL